MGRLAGGGGGGDCMRKGGQSAGLLAGSGNAKPGVRTTAVRRQSMPHHACMICGGRSACMAAALLQADHHGCANICTPIHVGQAVQGTPATCIFRRYTCAPAGTHFWRRGAWARGPRRRRTGRRRLGGGRFRAARGRQIGRGQRGQIGSRPAEHGRDRGPKQQRHWLPGGLGAWRLGAAHEGKERRQKEWLSEPGVAGMPCRHVCACVSTCVSRGTHATAAGSIGYLGGLVLGGLGLRTCRWRIRALKTCGRLTVLHRMYRQLAASSPWRRPAWRRSGRRRPG